ADPEVVHGRHAELRAGGGHAHDLDRAEVGGDEREAGDPGGQGPAGEEELDRGGDAALGVPAHTEDEGEVQRDDRVVDPLGVEAEVDHEAVPWGRGGWERRGTASGEVVTAGD